MSEQASHDPLLRVAHIESAQPLSGDRIKITNPGGKINRVAAAALLESFNHNPEGYFPTPEADQARVSAHENWLGDVDIAENYEDSRGLSQDDIEYQDWLRNNAQDGSPSRTVAEKVRLATIDPAKREQAKLRGKVKTNTADPDELMRHYALEAQTEIRGKERQDLSASEANDPTEIDDSLVYGPSEIEGTSNYRRTPSTTTTHAPTTTTGGPNMVANTTQAEVSQTTELSDEDRNAQLDGLQNDIARTNRLLNNYAEAKKKHKLSAEDEKAVAYLEGKVAEYENKIATLTPQKEVEEIDNDAARVEVAKHATKWNSNAVLYAEAAKKLQSTGKEMSDEHKLHARSTIEKAVEAEKALAHYDAIVNGGEISGEEADALANDHREDLMKNFEGIELRTSHEQIQDSYNNAQALADYILNTDPKALSDEERKKFGEMVDQLVLLQVMYPDAEFNTRGDDAIDNLIDLKKKLSSKDVLAGLDDEIAAKRDDTVKLSRPAAAAAASTPAATNGTDSVPAVTGNVQPVAAARPNSAERSQPKSRRGRLALLIAGLAAAGAGAGLWGYNAQNDDAKRETTELSTDDETGSTTTFEGTGATAGQSGASEKSPEQIAFEQKYPTLWGRTEAILEAAGKDKTVSAMDFLDSRIAKLPQGYSIVKIDQPGMGDGAASKNTYYQMTMPNGDVTTDTNKIGEAMGLSTIEDIKAALAEI